MAKMRIVPGPSAYSRDKTQESVRSVRSGLLVRVRYAVTNYNHNLLR